MHIVISEKEDEELEASKGPDRNIWKWKIICEMETNNNGQFLCLPCMPFDDKKGVRELLFSNSMRILKFVPFRNGDIPYLIFKWKFLLLYLQLFSPFVSMLS